MGKHNEIGGEITRESIGRARVRTRNTLYARTRLAFPDQSTRLGRLSAGTYTPATVHPPYTVTRVSSLSDCAHTQLIGGPKNSPEIVFNP